MSKAPILVGVTGGIGSGKSMVCKVFHHLGAPVYDADSRAKTLMTSDHVLVESIKQEFGEDSYQADGQLNRAYLSEKVFNNKEALQQLNVLVHPRVGDDFRRWVEANHGSPYLVKEAALMIESGSYKELDKLIVVLADKEIRIRRVLLRDTHRSREAIEAIMDKQLSDAEFKRHADYTIHNNGQKLILPHILKIHQELLDLASDRR